MCYKKLKDLGNLQLETGTCLRGMWALMCVVFTPYPHLVNKSNCNVTPSITPTPIVRHVLGSGLFRMSGKSLAIAHPRLPLPM